MKSTDRKKLRHPETAQPSKDLDSSSASSGLRMTGSSGRERISFERVEREKLIEPSSEDVEGVVEISLRPSRINEFIGQERLKENIKIALEAAQKRKEPLEHLLLSGPPGLGKTSLAHIVAHEMGRKILATSGPAIERAGDLIGILTNLEEGDIIFID